jgi:hypothetical protein
MFQSLYLRHVGVSNQSKSRKQHEACRNLAACFIPVSYLTYSSTLKIEATYSSETSVEFHRTTWRYIPQDRTVHNDRCGTIKTLNISFQNVIIALSQQQKIFLLNHQQTIKYFLGTDLA